MVRVKTHVLKCWPDYFEELFQGRKTADIRLNDRFFCVGDRVRFREFDDRKGAYTGRECYRMITHILPGGDSSSIPPLHGIRKQYVMLSLKEDA